MSVLTILYFIVSALYLYTGVSALNLDRKNQVHRVFFAMTFYMAIWSFSLCVASILVEDKAILEMRAFGRFFFYFFYSTLVLLSVCTLMKFRKWKHYLWIIPIYIPTFINIYLYLWKGPEQILISGKYYHEKVFGWPQNMGSIYDYFSAVNAALAFSFALFVFFRWGLKDKEKSKMKQSLQVNLTFLTLVIIMGYLSLYKNVFSYANIADFSVLIFSVQILTVYLLLVKNEFAVEAFSSSVLSTMEALQQGFLIMSEDNLISRVDSETEKLTGYSANQLHGKNVKFLFANMDSEDAQMVRADKVRRRVSIAQAEIYEKESDVKFRILSFRDIETAKGSYQELSEEHKILRERIERRKVLITSIDQKMKKEIEDKMKLERELGRLAYYDMLTDLPNRVKFHESLSAKMRENIRNIAVVIINIDNFKRINDTLGHNEGDRILVEFSELIRQCLKENEEVARVEGNEFLILFTGINHPNEIQVRVDELREFVRKEFYIKDLRLSLTMSSGATIWENDEDPQGLIYNANVALYGAKRKGVGGFELYVKNGKNYLKEKIKIRQEIERAIRRNEFELFFQPQVSTKSGKISGAEALIRWNHPERGLVGPGLFIPQIENENLIIKIGEWVVEDACRLIQQWQKQDRREFLPISVNLSMRHFESEDILYFLRSMISKYEVEPSNLKIEITESFRSSELHTLQSVLTKIREEKISISVDDFGTGYSSFHYLRNIKADVLKIPREYVIGIGKNQKTEFVIASLIRLAHNLNMKVIAEGVEFEEEKNFLVENKCDFIQGYYYYKPMNRSSLENAV